jgi:ribonuclease P protein component
MQRLRQRADFVAAAAGRKLTTAGFVLQARGRADLGPMRVGFTVSKKVGTAVERNRVRRRLKGVVGRLAVGPLRSGHDYVLIGRRAALTLSFDRMVEELKMALQRLEPRPARPDISAAPSLSPPACGDGRGGDGGQGPTGNDTDH